MTDFDSDIFKAKYQITEAAVELYKERGDSFTFKQVAEKTGLDVADIFDYFPNKKAVLQFYYESLIIRYRLMLEEIDDFDDYLLAEKLSNFALTSFDMMDEEADFVERTFEKIILCSSHARPSKKRSRTCLESFSLKIPGFLPAVLS